MLADALQQFSRSLVKIVRDYLVFPTATAGSTPKLLLQIGSAESGQFFHPCSGVACSPTNEIWVTSHDTVQAFTAEGKFLCQSAKPLPWKDSYGIDVAANGEVYVAESQCFDCGVDQEKGVCEACAKLCHAGHSLSEAVVSAGCVKLLLNVFMRVTCRFFCDCGAGGFKTACKALPAEYEAWKAHIRAKSNRRARKALGLSVDHSATKSIGWLCPSSTCGSENEPWRSLCSGCRQTRHSIRRAAPSTAPDIRSGHMLLSFACADVLACSATESR